LIGNLHSIPVIGQAGEVERDRLLRRVLCVRGAIPFRVRFRRR
jgi:hypothetical protein